MKKTRCFWCDDNSDIYKTYHDQEWGVPEFDDHKLFELLILEGMQAGLSWITILKKRANFRLAFDHFDFEIIAKYNEQKFEELIQNSGIIRNKLKIKASIKNAQVYIQIRKEFGSFSNYIWAYVGHQAIQNQINQVSDYIAKSPISEQISKDLKKRGMNFVGPTIIYAFMQAIGMVNDHEKACFRFQEVQQLKP